MGESDSVSASIPYYGLNGYIFLMYDVEQIWLLGHGSVQDGGYDLSYFSFVVALLFVLGASILHHTRGVLFLWFAWICLIRQELTRKMRFF